MSETRGHCIGCGDDNVSGELVNEVFGNSGGGWTNVLCAICKAAGRTPWRPRRPTDPNDWPTESGTPKPKRGRR